MATYTEIRQIFADDDFKNRVEVATVVAAFSLVDAASPTSADRAWARAVFQSPKEQGEQMLMAVLAANNSLTAAQITGATDAQLQTAVNRVVSQLVLAFSGV